MTLRCSNKDARRSIQARQDFVNHGGSLYGAHQYGMASLYVVYSYGQHFPVAVYESQTRQWFYNEDRYSATTSRHQSIVRQALPESYHRLDTEMMNTLIHCEGRKYKLAHQLGGDIRMLVKYAPLLEMLQP